MEFSRCARAPRPPCGARACTRSLKAQQRAAPTHEPQAARIPGRQFTQAVSGVVCSDIASVDVVLGELVYPDGPATAWQCQTNRTIDGTSAHRSNSSGFPRKEVIQPHLPVRLPCYDFTPIIDPTFDGCLLAVSPPASGVADFRGVTGGVYKARERIHRGVADPRLLATPPSWRRVAASNPNRDRLFGIRSPSRVCSPLYRPM
jgi:hypothetical protein